MNSMLGITNCLVIRGRIVTMNQDDEVIDDGFICIKNNKIEAVISSGSRIPAVFRNATTIETNGTIYPGLIELHNHLPYNFLPLWDVPNKFVNRNEWIFQSPEYLPAVKWPAAVIAKNTDSDYQKAVARYVECRTLFGGVTTTQGISSRSTYYNGLTRNVEKPLYEDWPVAKRRTPDYKPHEIESKLVPALEAGTPFFYHLSEGTDRDARQRFLDLEWSEDEWAIKSNLIAIHAVGLESSDFEYMTKSAGIVWSPTSNYLLYGETAKISNAIRLGIPIALGCDWSPSGTKNLLGELKIAQIVSEHYGNLFNNKEIVKTVTTNPAKMIGWDKYIGSIKAGLHADLIVVDNHGSDPYHQLITAIESDIVTVIIDGKLRLWRKDLLSSAATNIEQVSIGSRLYHLDLVDNTASGLEGLSLNAAITKLENGLLNMPTLAAEHIENLNNLVKSQSSFMNFDENLEWGLDMEHWHEETLKTALFDAQGIRPDLMFPMTLPPITSVDDAAFDDQLKNNANLPRWLISNLN